MRVDSFEVFDGVFVAELTDDFEVDGTRLIFLDKIETESIDDEDGKLLRTVGDPEFSHKGFGVVAEFVEFYFVFGESGPEADVDHDVPVGEV